MYRRNNKLKKFQFCGIATEGGTEVFEKSDTISKEKKTVLLPA